MSLCHIVRYTVPYSVRFWCDWIFVDEVIRTVGEGTFGKVVECRDMRRYIDWKSNSSWFYNVMYEKEVGKVECSGAVTRWKIYLLNGRSPIIGIFINW
jgi:hypothetical protein